MVYVQKHKYFEKFWSELKLNFPVRGFDVVLESTKGERVMCQKWRQSFRQEERLRKFS